MTAEARIRELCSQLLAAQDDDQVQKLVSQLKTAIHDHCADLKLMAAVSYPKAKSRSVEDANVPETGTAEPRKGKAHA